MFYVEDRKWFSPSALTSKYSLKKPRVDIKGQLDSILNKTNEKEHSTLSKLHSKTDSYFKEMEEKYIDIYQNKLINRVYEVLRLLRF